MGAPAGRRAGQAGGRGSPQGTAGRKVGWGSLGEKMRGLHGFREQNSSESSGRGGQGPLEFFHTSHHEGEVRGLRHGFENLGDLMLSETTESQKDEDCTIPLT